MKKILLIILTFIFIPLNINAAEIVDAEILGTTEKSIGEEITLDFKVNISGVEKGIDKTLGIWLAGFELIFDSQNLIVTSISSNDFNSYIYKENDKYYVISEVIENSTSDKICSNKILYCSDYEVSINFYIKNTESRETTIKMGEIEIGLLDIIDENKTYSINDLISINKLLDKSHTIKINKPNQTITEEFPEEIINDTNPVNKLDKKMKSENKQENVKSSNAFIKNIKIKNHDIKFEKNKTNYNITLLENINELDIDVTLDDELSTYRIIGADDLKNNNNEIAIIVTAEDGNDLTYTINIKYTDKIEEVNLTSKINIKNTLEKKLTKENLTYIAIGLGIIIIIILLIILKNKNENKKINKLLGEL